MRNAVLFASAFSVMLFAPLTPYITVGAFIVSMMLLSAVMTIIYSSLDCFAAGDGYLKEEVNNERVD